MPLRKYLPVAAIILIALCSFINSSPSLKQYDLNKNIQDTTPVLEEDENKKFASVEIEAEFPGGDNGWIRFLTQNLNSEVPIKKKAPAGVYTVIIQFIVNTDGTISEFKPLTNLGYGMEEEVIRVLKNSPRWKPAIQDKRKVRAYRKQPVTFQVEEKKKKKSKDDDR